MYTDDLRYRHSSPECEALIGDFLGELPPGVRWRHFEWHDSLGSTSDRARALAEGDPGKEFVVVAEDQTAGRGRLSRAWVSERGANLLFSVTLTAAAAAMPGRVVAAFAVSVAETVRSSGAAGEAVIKWPNDVLIDGRKCAGILLESISGNGPTSRVIGGIGLNVNQLYFPGGLNDSATSLARAAGRPLGRPRLLAQLLVRLDANLDLLDSGSALMDRYRELMWTPSMPLSTQSRRGPVVSGRVVGITDEGALLLSTSSGIISVFAGDVMPAARNERAEPFK